MLLAVVDPEVLSAAQIAERHRVSHTHVQKVVQALRREGFVTTRRGPGGGVRLARPASEIRLGDVVRAMEPHLRLVVCFDPNDETCVLAGSCALTGALMRASAAFFSVLDATTLADVARSKQHLIDRLSRAATAK
ncbi:MAG: Rrf2 family transcriptional regulator [Alphaproteobacteria bacterium]|nr:Rrf2 family transcriptional regulator [Alphaproteobacteria bacterium]MCB9697030.1 Rrf2 family transcriptional regulator [Alphaproteobacteria bacterium]